jgi:GT2 family glycosyltransferase
MTVVVSSYQRREPLLRMLRGLDRQLAASEELRQDLAVLVVLDGSTDGSREAIETNAWTVPVRVLWQPNRGLAAARNVGLAAAAGGIVWFLDDDLVPAPGLVERHRRAHRPDSPAVVVGACRMPSNIGAPAALVRWWHRFYEELEATPAIDRFDRFTSANTSAPASLLTAVGGFDEGFVDAGAEDYELAVRLLAAGTPLRFDAGALAWHHGILSMSATVARERSAGLNQAHLVHLHPEMVDSVFPIRRISAPMRLLRQLRLCRPRFLMALSWIALGIHRVSQGIHPPLARWAEGFSRGTARAAGVAKGDPGGTLLDRFLGYSGEGDSGPGPVRPPRSDGPSPAEEAKSSP